MTAIGEPATIRLLSDDDSIAELTALLHRAYRRLGDMGLHYVAVDQSEEVTRRRIRGAECYVAFAHGALTGTITFHRTPDPHGSAWYARPDVACFHQFAVEPGLQGRGIGSALLDLVERRARETGAAEIACDTAEPAEHLIRFYTRRGYRIVEHVDWRPVTNYPSVVLSKTLTR